jgi:hypothetical protein
MVRLEVGVDREAEQAAVPVGVHVRGDVEQRLRLQLAAAHEVHAPGLLSDEHAPVGGPRDGGRRVEAGGQRAQLEAGRQGGRARRRRQQGEGGRRGGDQPHGCAQTTSTMSV